jgi:hypothetical protein
MITVVALTKTQLGTLAGEHSAFGEEMLDKFLHTMEPEELRPDAICLYTDGVKLACEGSPVRLGLTMLEGLGVRVLVSQACLDYFNLRDKHQLGHVVALKDIVSELRHATRVLYP